MSRPQTQPDAEVFSEALAYPQTKKRSVAARSFRTKLSPSNGSVFAAGSTINLDLPGNLAGQYYNFNQMYLKFKLHVAGGTMHLDRAGALSCIKRIQIQTAGAQLFDLNNYNVLATALMDTNSSAEYKASSGNILMGTLGDQLQGVLLAANSETTFCVPMMLNPFSMTTPHRMIPAFSLGAIQFKITLENSINIGKSSVAAPTLICTYSDVELVSLMCELSPGAQSRIDSVTGGQYNILANSYINSQGNIATNLTQATVNLGVSVSSLERVIVVHRRDATVSTFGTFNLGHRTTSGLQEFQFLINSENYPSRPIICNNTAESYAELLIADHCLTDFKLGNTLTSGCEPLNAQTADAASVQPTYSVLSGTAPGLAKSNCFYLKDGAGTSAGTVAASGAAHAPATASNIGTFLCSCEFENGISDGRSSHIYSGVSTISSNVQYKGTYSNVHAAATIDFFSQFTVMISLNMRGSGVYAISV